MALKPIDFQVMIPKTSEVAKIHSEENHKSVVNQHHTTATFQQQTQHRLKNVNATDKAYEGKIKEKQKDGKKKQSKKQDSDKDHKHEEEQQHKRGSSKGSSIDIRI